MKTEPMRNKMIGQPKETKEGCSIGAKEGEHYMTCLYKKHGLTKQRTKNVINDKK